MSIAQEVRIRALEEKISILFARIDEIENSQVAEPIEPRKTLTLRNKNGEVKGSK